MLIKAAIIFLAAMLAIAMIGNLLFPGRLQQRLKGRAPKLAVAKCQACGRPKIGKGPCPCGKG